MTPTGVSNIPNPNLIPTSSARRATTQLRPSRPFDFSKSSPPRYSCNVNKFPPETRVILLGPPVPHARPSPRMETVHLTATVLLISRFGFNFMRKSKKSTGSKAH